MAPIFWTSARNLGSEISGLCNPLGLFSTTVFAFPFFDPGSSFLSVWSWVFSICAMLFFLAPPIIRQCFPTVLLDQSVTGKTGETLIPLMGWRDVATALRLVTVMLPEWLIDAVDHLERAVIYRRTTAPTKAFCPYPSDAPGWLM